MSRYLILDPEILKRAVVHEVDVATEQAAVESIPSGVPVPKVVVVIDVQRVARMPRFVVDDATDDVLDGTVQRVRRQSEALAGQLPEGPGSEPPAPEPEPEPPAPEPEV